MGSYLPSTDILLYIALSEEFNNLSDELIDELGNKFNSIELDDMAITVFCGLVFSSVLNKYCQITVVPSGKMGITRAASVISPVIIKSKARNVVVLGIAGSISNDLQPGDVFIPDSVNEYLANSATEGKKVTWLFQTSGNHMPTNPRLLNRFQMFQSSQKEFYDKWFGDCSTRFAPLVNGEIQKTLVKAGINLRPEINLLAGDDKKLASGPAVGKGKAFIEWIRQEVDRKVAAIEMESAGIYDATFIHTPAPRVIAIRGISDFADERKVLIEDAAKDQFRSVSLKNAFSLLMHGIKAGLFGDETLGDSKSYHIEYLPRDNGISTFKNSVELKEKLKIILDVSTKRKAIPSLSLNNITKPESNFIGRVKMLEKITEWYKNPNIHIGSLIGWGGEGKSALLRKWYDTLKENNIQRHSIFWWGFYDNAYFNPFLDSLFNYLSQDSFNLNDYRTNWLKVIKIKELLLNSENLIILDGLEEMQKSEETGDMFGCMLHREFSEILKFLADTNVKGLCLITSRYPLTDIIEWEGASYQRLDVDQLSIEEGKALFKKIGVSGNSENIETVIKDYKCHALSLTLLAKYLVKDYKGNIERANDIPPFYSDKEAGGKAHRILLWYEQQITEAQRSFMKIFSIFRIAVQKRDFEGVFRSKITTNINQSLVGMSNFSFNRMIDNLCERNLITKNQNDSYTTHPLIKNFFEYRFKDKEKKLCHKRIYEYIGSYAPEKPDTFEEMQPLFEQVYHGCQAGLYDEVLLNTYIIKIQRAEPIISKNKEQEQRLSGLRFNIYGSRSSIKIDEYYLTDKFAAWETNLSLLLNFFPKGNLFEMPRASKTKYQSFILHAVGTSLYAIGRPSEAEEIEKKSVKMVRDDKDWENAIVIYEQLVENQFRIGKIDIAKATSEKAIKLSEKIKGKKKKQFQATSKTYLAYTLFLLGETERSRKLFIDVNNIFREIWPKIGGLYSYRGVYYTDFLIRTNSFDEAFKISIKNLQVCKNHKWSADISRCHRSIGALHRINRNYEESEKYLNTAFEIAKNIDIPFLGIEALIERGRLKLETDKYSEAVDDLNNTLMFCDRTGFKLYEPDAEIVLAKVYLALKDIDKAKKYVNSAYKKADQMSYYWPKIEASNLLTEILLKKKMK
jgi:nucleoside phosphorylase/tetratricopeptide (TPR) repeat protein